jgi:hypothetical protein
MALMTEIAEKVKSLNGLSFMNVQVSDNLISSVSLHGSFDVKDSWAYNIFHNSRYCIFMIRPMKGKRYYDTSDEKVEVELISSSKVGKFRKYTGSVDKVLSKMQDWINSNKG